MPDVAVRPQLVSDTVDVDDPDPVDHLTVRDHRRAGHHQRRRHRLPPATLHPAHHVDRQRRDRLRLHLNARPVRSVAQRLVDRTDRRRPGRRRDEPGHRLRQVAERHAAFLDDRLPPMTEQAHRSPPAANATANTPSPAAMTPSGTENIPNPTAVSVIPASSPSVVSLSRIPHHLSRRTPAHRPRPAPSPGRPSSPAPPQRRSSASTCPSTAASRTPSSEAPPTRPDRRTPATRHGRHGRRRSTRTRSDRPAPSAAPTAGTPPSAARHR